MLSTLSVDPSGKRWTETEASLASIEARSVSRAFRDKRALDDVSLSVPPGEIHALLGPNGAGKTTLLRILTGLTAPGTGAVRVAGCDPVREARAVRRRIGFIPSGDRSFYLRLSGLENLAFFARLHGHSRRQALARAREVLEDVDLAEAASVSVGLYSHGMQKRLSVARALLNDPDVFLVDEATHDLDPDGVRRVQALVEAAARRGAAVLWTTQRLDEIRGFADRVTLLSRGRVRFCGSVAELMTHASPRRYLIRLRNGRLAGPDLAASMRPVLAGLGTLAAVGPQDPEHHLLSIPEDGVLGDALAALTSASVDVLACREERSEIEQAFISLTQDRT